MNRGEKKANVLKKVFGVDNKDLNKGGLDKELERIKKQDSDRTKEVRNFKLTASNLWC